jgi:hypothetical protein
MAAKTAILAKEPDITAITQKAQKGVRAVRVIEDAQPQIVYRGVLWPPRGG